MRKNTFPILSLTASVLFNLVFCATPMMAAPPAGQDPQVPEITMPRRPSLPPDFGDKGTAQPLPKTPRYDSARAHRDAQQLAVLAQKISVQVDEVSNNAVPKDLLLNLKELQKLAKHLRSEIPE